ncbi:MAG: hypothetical protein ACYDAD_10520 [Acidimicrobiales bacterium]
MAHRRDRVVVRAAALWTAFVWLVFIRNLARDHTHSTGFKAVHGALAVVSLGFAAALWRVSRSRSVE